MKMQNQRGQGTLANSRPCCVTVQESESASVMTKAQKQFLLMTLGAALAVLSVVIVGLVLYCLKMDTFQRCKFTRRSIESVERSLKIYAISHNGKLPASLYELTRSTDDQPGLLNEGGLIDCWRKPFKYENIGNTFKITSSGPDRKMDTEDDITN